VKGKAVRGSLKLLTIAAALAGLALAMPAGLAADKEQVIKDRQAAMKDQVREWIVIRNYLQGKADQAAALSAAASLRKSVPEVVKYFPPGTEGPAPDGKWGAKPEIWTEHDKFLAANKKVADQVAALDAALKTGDRGKVEVAFKELDTCNACHRTFRAKLQ
jgi:cytochrome c556